MNSRSGYTLLEALIAFAIMASVLAVLLPGQGAQLRQSAGMNTRFLATSYAQSRLDQIGIVEPLEVAVWTESYRDWIVELEVGKGAESPGLPNHFTVSVSVLSTSGKRIARLQTVKVGAE